MRPLSDSRSALRRFKMTIEITGISSMATRQVLADLVADYARISPDRVQIESVGGVDAAKRVQADEVFDAVFLSSEAIGKLAAAGKVQAGSAVDLVHSGVAVAVRGGTPHPDISSEAGVRAAVLAARTVSYSTGPSGVALAQLFERWGIAAEIQPRIVQAPPGVPVGSLVAKGEVELGFQQLSELLHVAGIDIVGPLPPAIQITTTFTGAVCSTARRPEVARALLRFLASPAAAEAKRRHGMDPA